MGIGLVPFYSTAKSTYSALEHIKQHGEVPYQKTQLKSMAHAVYPHIPQYVLAQCAVLPQC